MCYLNKLDIVTKPEPKAVEWGVALREKINKFAHHRIGQLGGCPNLNRKLLLYKFLTQRICPCLGSKTGASL